jgi:predicted O-methyltransferase YrrM
MLKFKKIVLYLLNLLLLIPVVKIIPKFLFRVHRVFNRLKFSYSYYSKNLTFLAKWIFKDTEDSNFYYRLNDLNKLHLVSTMAYVTGLRIQQIQSYLNEIEDDMDLRNEIENFLKGSDYGRDVVVEFGRRLGWYILVRSQKPKIIVETGVYHGVGSIVLTSALLRNKSEGFGGFYYGTDIDINSGKLLQGKYAEVGKILFGDSITTLRQFDEKIDLFINDSDHSAQYEAMEYEVVAPKLSENAIILGDNSHSTSALYDFSLKTGRGFLFFKEMPTNHWYPGAGIGISITANKNRESIEFQ